MATTTIELSKRINSAGKSEIIIRLSSGRGRQFRLRAGIYVRPERFKNGAIIKPRANPTEAADLRAIESEIAATENFLLDLCANTPPESQTREYFTRALSEFHGPGANDPGANDPDFFHCFDEFLRVRPISEVRKKNYKVLRRALQRFEAYRNAITPGGYALALESLAANDLSVFRVFLRDEHLIFKQFRGVLAEYQYTTRAHRKCPAPAPRGNNTISGMFSRLRAFINWCRAQGVTDNNPFAKFTGAGTERYGTPYYLTVDERDTIAGYDLTARPALAAQRDIFIFQCLIGCRVSDLVRLTPANIIAGGVEYIATKTKADSPEVIRVPLHPRAVEIIERYKDTPGDKLLPFISPQKYNAAIKQIFTICGVAREVTIINPTSGQEEHRPLNEIASSHIARRTFIGNLYKQVKDPNLVGKLSGHKEGSRAFARYRDIDEDMKRELINLL